MIPSKTNSLHPRKLTGETLGSEVAERYRELISQLNVPFSLEKSLVSSVGALEFAKRFFVRGVTKDLSPVSCRMLRSLVSSISLVSVMRAIMSTDLPLSYRLREAGYRVYTRRTAPPRASAFPRLSLTERCVSSPFSEISLFSSNIFLHTFAP